MRIHRSTKGKAALLTLCAVIAAALLFVPQMSSYAAGDINVQIGEIQGAGNDFPGFTFDLYEVGAYDGPDFKLNDSFKDVQGVNVQIPRKEDYDKQKKPGDPSWEEAWQQSAKNLANYIKTPAEGAAAIAPVQTFNNIKAGTPVRYHSDKNALFLLVGHTVQYNKQNYTPVPMFVRTLNGEETYTVGTAKVEITPVVYDHALAKEWSGEPTGAAAALRPAAIDVGIYYGSTLIDTVTLGGEGGEWTYSWKSEESGNKYKYIGSNGTTKEFTPQGDPVWSVREFTSESEMKSDAAKAAAGNLRFYSPDCTPKTSATAESFIITNTLTYKSLELEKVIDGYYEGDQNATFSFLVKGFKEGNNTETPDYTNHIGITMNANEGVLRSMPATLNYIPADITRIEVTEEYSGNYTPGEISISNDNPYMWYVTAQNTHSGHGPKSGVVNTYRNVFDENLPAPNQVPDSPK